MDRERGQEATTKFYLMMDVCNKAKAYRLACEEDHGGPEWDAAWDDLCRSLDALEDRDSNSIANPDKTASN